MSKFETNYDATIANLVEKLADPATLQQVRIYAAHHDAEDGTQDPADRWNDTPAALAELLVREEDEMGNHDFETTPPDRMADPILADMRRRIDEEGMTPPPGK